MNATRPHSMLNVIRLVVVNVVVVVVHNVASVR